MGKLVRIYKGEPGELRKDIIAAANQVADFKEQSITSVEGADIYFMVFNRYFLRTNGETSLSLMIISRAEETRLTAISAGNGYGVLRFDLGAADKMIQQLKESLELQGLRGGAEEGTHRREYGPPRDLPHFHG